MNNLKSEDLNKKQEIQTFFKGILSSTKNAFEKFSEAKGKDKITLILLFIKKYKFPCLVFSALIIIASCTLYIKMVHNESYVLAEEPSTSTTTTQTTTEASTETTTSVLCHYNADGKLYGTKGKFSGIWPQLEQAAKASKEQYIKDLMVYVGDNTELEQCSYEEDKFKQINGYGTVHWHQVGHKWPNKYSCAYNGIITYDSANLFKVIKSEEKFDETTEITSNTIEENGNVPVMGEIALSDSAIEISVSESTVEMTTEEITEAESLSVTEESTKAESPVSASSNKVDTSSFAEGKVWAGNSCGTCSLAMALSTLSGVTVSPPEVALAANLLIGKSAWYEVILYSKAQAKLAQLAGFPVYMEPWNSAKKETMDACLNANGVALFVTKGSDWVANGGRHYIMVRNKVGDKYYTADSGKNPTHSFTYEQISAGYCQQYIVYIYPKTNAAQNTTTTSAQK